MEERILDDDGRLIKIKKTKKGDDFVDDAAPEGAPEGETPEETDDGITVEFPEDDEYDENLVGLTPTQLKEELERREREAKARRAECDTRIETGKTYLEAGEYDEAETAFKDALSFVWDDETAHELLWRARTHDYTDIEAYFSETNVKEFLEAPENIQKGILERDGEKLTKEREAIKNEAQPLEKVILEKRKERREPLQNNKNYYKVRLIVLLVCLLGAAIAAVISLDCAFRTTSIAPVITASVFGACAVGLLIASVFFARFYIVAKRLCVANETLSSSEDGRRLMLLQHREACLSLLLDPEEEDGE